MLVPEIVGEILGFLYAGELLCTRATSIRSEVRLWPYNHTTNYRRNFYMLALHDNCRCQACERSRLGTL